MATVRANLFDELQKRHVAFNVMDLTYMINHIDHYHTLIVQHYNQWFQSGDPPFAWIKLPILLEKRMSESNSTPLWLDLRKEVKAASSQPGPTSAESAAAAAVAMEGYNVWAQLKDKLFLMIAQDSRSLDMQGTSVGQKRSFDQFAAAVEAVQQTFNDTSDTTNDQLVAVVSESARYRYTPSNSNSGSASSSSNSSSNVRPAIIKDGKGVGICYAYMRGGVDSDKGGCSRGLACKFSHDWEQGGGPIGSK